MLIPTPIIAGEDGVPPGLAAGGTGNFDFGVDPGLDPELALVSSVPLRRTMRPVSGLWALQFLSENSSSNQTLASYHTCIIGPAYFSGGGESPTGGRSGQGQGHGHAGGPGLRKRQRRRDGGRFRQWRWCGGRRRGRAPGGVEDVDGRPSSGGFCVEREEERMMNGFAGHGECIVLIEGSLDAVVELWDSGEGELGTFMMRDEDVNMDDLSEEEQIARAIAMSMQGGSGGGQESGEDFSQVMQDPSFLTRVLDSLPGVDSSDPRIQSVLQGKDSEKKEGEEDKEKK
ncbi:hypothetical protein BC936DRAFT_145681 [Jimgerdemannia flammicorona]|uniref:Uncharacterized protein n=1 Tax=Jimgerdemannia flammicorona TaxID=994334 RepID=A0A433DA42_9FUNG|nr:hypothetical protein BC936DRAFT_145681 [Jimgerdemannia flammicorona]